MARRFLLKGETYCRFGLPDYIEFERILADVDKYLETHKLNSVAGKVREHDEVNHTILDNKDGRYAWRPMELIHPVLYVDLVRSITEKGNWKALRRRFKELMDDHHIACMSTPIQGRKGDGKRPRRDRAAMIRQWWEDIEQQSIRLSLEFEYVWHTDITDCYGSLYTHSVAWAMHGKGKASSTASVRRCWATGSIGDCRT